MHIVSFSHEVLVLVPSFHAQILTSTSNEMELKLENQMMFLVKWTSSLLSASGKCENLEHSPVVDLESVCFCMHICVVMPIIYLDLKINRFKSRRRNQ